MLGLEVTSRENKYMNKQKIRQIPAQDSHALSSMSSYPDPLSIAGESTLGGGGGGKNILGVC